MLELEFDIERIKREVEEETKEKIFLEGLGILRDFKVTLPKYGLKLLCEFNMFYFEVGQTQYFLDLFNRKYTTKRGNRWGGEYSFKNCLNMLETIKLYFWEFRAIEVLPQIELIPLLQKSGKSMADKRRWGGIDPSQATERKSKTVEITKKTLITKKDFDDSVDYTDRINKILVELDKKNEMLTLGTVANQLGCTWQCIAKYRHLIDIYCENHPDEYDRDIFDGQPISASEVNIFS